MPARNHISQYHHAPRQEGEVGTEVDGAASDELGLPLDACRQTKAVAHDVPGCLRDSMEVHVLRIRKAPADGIDVVQ